MPTEIDLPPGVPTTAMGAGRNPVASVGGFLASGQKSVDRYLTPTPPPAAEVPQHLVQTQGWADRARGGILKLFGLDIPVASPTPAPVTEPKVSAAPEESTVYKRRLAEYSSAK